MKPASGIPHRLRRDQSLGLSLDRAVPVGARTSLVTGLRLEIGRHDYLLPEGLGPFVDPISIGFRRVALTPNIGLRHRWPVDLPPGGEAEVSLRLGHEVSRLDTRLRSALLDVRSRQTLGQSHLTLGAGLRLAQGPALKAMVRMGEGGVLGWRSELQLPLGR